MATQIQLRRGTAAAWTSANPTLAQGEFGVETDTYKLKLGDGTTAWTSLGYYIPTQDLEDLVNVVISSETSGQVLQYNGVNWVNADIDALPSQTGESGKYLTTDGTTASWATVDALPDQTGNSGQYLTTDGTTASWTTLSVSSDPNPQIFMLMGA